MKLKQLSLAAILGAGLLVSGSQAFGRDRDDYRYDNRYDQRYDSRDYRHDYRDDRRYNEREERRREKERREWIKHQEKLERERRKHGYYYQPGARYYSPGVSGGIYFGR